MNSDVSCPALCITAPVLQVGVSDGLYHFIHDLWLENQPIGELS